MMNLSFSNYGGFCLFWIASGMLFALGFILSQVIIQLICYAFFMCLCSFFSFMGWSELEERALTAAENSLSH